MKTNMRLRAREDKLKEGLHNLQAQHFQELEEAQVDRSRRRTQRMPKSG